MLLNTVGEGIIGSEDFKKV